MSRGKRPGDPLRAKRELRRIRQVSSGLPRFPIPRSRVGGRRPGEEEPACLAWEKGRSMTRAVPRTLSSTTGVGVV